MTELEVSPETQLRTFLIADVRGYTRFTQEQGDEAAAKLAARFAVLCRDGVAARGGQVVELRGDEALAVFGSARQALRAAVELQSQFAQETQADPSLPLKVGIGLDAGEAIPVEGGYRGGALNLAARLCSLAGPGEVLASDGVVHLARKMEGLAYAERGLVQLKGFADPVRVVQVHPSSPEGTMHWPLPGEREDALPEGERRQPLPIGGFLGALPAGMLVARDEEVSRVLTAVDAVAGGSGRLVLLSGEPGVGKTRLAQEVTLHVRNRGFLVASGRCYEPHQAVPFYPFLEALGAAHRAAPPAIRADAAQRWPYLARLLPDQLGPLPMSSSDSQEERQRLFRAVAGFLQAIAGEMPVALLLDDLHWADSASLELLQHLARHTRAYPVLLLGTYRDVEVGRQHPLEQALRDLHREQLAERMAVRRLGQDGTAALVAATFGEAEVSAEFAGLVHRHTEGNPFFTQEVLRALVERGDIYRQNGRWERREVEEIEVPESVRSVIGERLSRLHEEAQEVLREASVLGQTFSFDVLQAMGARAEEEVEGALEEAGRAGLVRETVRDIYAFNHALTQQALYAELSGRKKRRLHLAAGEALQKLPEHERHAAELAWHFLEGGDPRTALPYAIQAGDQAEAVFAHAEAERQYRTALGLARELDDRAREAEALEKLGVVLRTVAHLDEALETLEQAAQLYRAAPDPEGEKRVVAQIGFVHAVRTTPDQGVARVRSLLDSLDRPEPSSGLAALYVTLADLFSVSGRYTEQLEAAERAAELARAVGDERLLIMAEGRRGVALQLLGRDAEGFQVQEEIIQLAESVGDLDSLFHALNNAAVAYQFRGDFPRWTLYQTRSFEAAQRLGGPRGIAFGLARVSVLGYHLGDWDKARRDGEQAVAILRPLDTSWSLAVSLAVLGHICLFQGDWEEASRYLEECIAISEPSNYLQGLAWAAWGLAQKEILEGRAAAAEERLEALIDRGAVDDHVGPFILPVQAWAYLEAGDMPVAEETVSRSVQPTTPRLALVDALRVQGMVLSRQERWEEAERVFAEDIALARSLPFPYAEARGLYEHGMMRIRKGDPEQARQHLEAALTIFRQLGAKKDVERTEQALTDDMLMR